MSSIGDGAAAEAGSLRLLPNILFTGTPGTGKTTHAALLVDAATSPYALRHINVGDFVKAQGCHEGWNEEWQSWIVDEDKLLDALEPILSSPQGGIVLDWHSCDLFPERWLDLVLVLRTPHTTLWDRLEKRGYPLKKIQENNEAEIMEMCLGEARESYAEEAVVELQSAGSGMDEIEANVQRVVQWIQQWRKDQGVDGENAALRGE